MSISADIATLRAGAKVIREEWQDPRGGAWSTVQTFYLAVADLLDAEAATLGELEPMAELFSVAIEKSGGPIGYLKIEKDSEGNPQMRSDTTPSSVRVAMVALGEGAA